MTPSRISFSLTTVAALLAFSPFIACADQQTITVTDPRPVQAGVAHIEDMYRVPITYEDTRYTHDWERRTDDQGHLVAIGETLSFSYQTPDLDATPETRKALAANALADLLKNHTAAHSTQMFSVIPTAAGLHVVAVKFSDTNGATAQLRPLLNTPVTITPEDRTGYQLLQQILSAVNRANDPSAPLGIGLVPKILQESHTSIGATNEPARSVLDRLFSEMPVHAMQKIPGRTDGALEHVPAYLSWQLRADPDPRWGSGAFSIYVVKPPSAH